MEGSQWRVSLNHNNATDIPVWESREQNLQFSQGGRHVWAQASVSGVCELVYGQVGQTALSSECMNLQKQQFRKLQKHIYHFLCDS